MKENFRSRLNEIENLIRQGDEVSARKGLTSLPSKFPRDFNAQVASLSRRANCALVGVKLLNPFIRPHRMSSNATEDEKCQYAACLTKLGATEEAIQILEELKVKKRPEGLLFLAFAYISRWDYSSALPILKNYLENSDLTPILRLNGELNWVACLISLARYEESEVFLRGLLAKEITNKLPLARGMVLELCAQNAILRDSFAEADNYLKEASIFLIDKEGLYAFFVRKWRIILELLRSRHKEKAIESLRDLQTEARLRKHWETIRDCDLFQAMATRNHNLYFHLYFGTPFEGFRKRLALLFGETIPLPDEYTWVISGAEKKSCCLDLVHGECAGRRIVLKSGYLIDRLIHILCSDYYRPLRVAAIHHKLYLDEYFNPFTSPLRVHQALIRMRKWLKQYQIPMSIEEDDGSYALKGNAACQIIVRRKPLLEKHSSQLNKLKEVWPILTFSAIEAKTRLHISYRSTMRVLEKGRKQGLLNRLGDGKKTKYKFAA